MKLMFSGIFLFIAVLVFSGSVFAVPEPPGEYIGNLILTQQFSNEPIQIVSTPQNTHYLVTNKQSYYSANGKNWEIKNSDLPTAGGLAIDSSGNLYISGSDVYKSIDGGVTWNRVGQAGELGSTPNLKVKIVQGTLYAWHPDQGLYYYNPSLGHWYIVISPTQYKVYDFMIVGDNAYYVGVQNGEVKLFHGLTPKGTITGATVPSYTTLYRKLLTYYDGAFYVILKKTAGGGAIYKSSDFGQTWEKVHDTPDAPASISSSTVNGIQVVTSGKVWRSWSGAVWKEVKQFTGGGIDIVSTNADKQTIVAAGYSMYTYDRNAYPILNLTKNYNINPGQTQQLTANVQDLDDSQFTYSWTKVSGPINYTLTGSTTQIATFSSPKDGTYKINLTVTDMTGGKTTETVTVIVGSGTELSANAGQDKTCHVGSECYLYSLNAYPTATYLWQQLSGPPITWKTANQTTGAFTPTTLGTYVIKLTIAVNGTSATDEVIVTVNNHAPVIDVTASQLCVVEKECQINSTVADQDPTDAITIKWLYNLVPLDDPAFTSADLEVVRGANTQRLVIIPYKEDYYTLTISAADGFIVNGKTTVSKSVTLQVVDQKSFDEIQTSGLPIANAGENQTVNVNQEIILSGNRSFDPFRNLINFSWDQISGPQITINNANTVNPTFTPSEIGVYIIRLNVTNSLGSSDFSDVTINVLAEGQSTPSPTVTQAASTELVSPQPTASTEVGNKPPVIQVKETLEAKLGEQITVDSLAVDPEGGELTYSWNQIGGEEINIENKASPTLKFTGSKSGLYTFEITVTDRDGKTATKRVAVKLTEVAKPLQGEQNILLWIVIGIISIVVVVGLVFWKIKRK